MFENGSSSSPYLPITSASLRRGLAASGSPRCCLKRHSPRVEPYASPGSVAGTLRSAPCTHRCRMPRVDLPYFTPTPEEEREAKANASEIPWVPVQQRRQWKRTLAHTAAHPPRVAVCLAGSTRAFVHPMVWRSIEQHVLGRAGGGAHRVARRDVFVALATGPEESPFAAHRRAKRYTPAADMFELSQWTASYTWSRRSLAEEMPWEAGEAQAELLSHALSGLRPRGVRLRTVGANLSCGLPPSIQFARWADCVDLVQEYEERHGGARRCMVLLVQRAAAHIGATCLPARAKPLLRHLPQVRRHLQDAGRCVLAGTARSRFTWYLGEVSYS